MKVAFLIHSLEVSGCRYRVLQYLPYLKEQGVQTSVHFFKQGFSEKRRFYDSLGSYDAFFVHRRLFPPPEFWYLRRRAKKIVFDFDDAIMYRSSSARHPRSFSRRLKFAYLMRRVDTVIAGNEFLKSEVLPYNARVEVIPTSIDLSRVDGQGEALPAHPPTIGWLGSSSTLKYLKALLPTLEDLYRAYPHFQLKVVCNEFFESHELPLVKKRWSSEEEAADLRSFDIGLMPLSDDLWTQGKCGLKILQYHSVGVPVVCTPVGVNRDIVQDGVNGFWAENEAQWKERLLTLLREGGLRKEMGRRGRRVVEEGYSVRVNGPRILNLLKRVCGEGRG